MKCVIIMWNNEIIIMKWNKIIIIMKIIIKWY